jgi:hypothetical protein
MPRYQGTTTARGYGGRHQAERERRLKQYQPGDPCARGGEPMTWPLSVARRYVDLPHDHANGGYLPGLACRAHNRAEGGARGGKARARKRRPSRPFTTSRAW